MNTLRTDLLQWQRLRDEAVAEAQALRREAIADFWRGANGLLTDVATQARRSAERLARRLQRRAQALGPG